MPPAAENHRHPSAVPQPPPLARRTPPSDRASVNVSASRPAPQSPQRPGTGTRTNTPAHAPPSTTTTTSHRTRAPFSWSSSILTMLTVIGCFAVLCSYAASASTLFALYAAPPVYALYPALVAAMLVGGASALICYLPTMLAVLTFQLLFGADIRVSHTPPPALALAQAHGHANGNAQPQGSGNAQGARQMRASLIRDGASTIKLALLVAPVYVLAVGRAGGAGVQIRALDAAAGGQLAAGLMTLKIMAASLREIWDLVPIVVLKWHRDAQR